MNHVRPSLTKEATLLLVSGHDTIWEAIEASGWSKNTIRNKMKKYSIPTPKGFFSRGKPVGRPPGFKHTEEYKQAMSERFRGERNPFYGKRHSEETRRKMSENHADFTGDNNPFRKSLRNNPAKVQEHRKRCKEIWAKRGVQWRQRFGEKLSAREYTAPPSGRHFSSPMVTTKGGMFTVRSSWEFDFAFLLEESPLVQRFRYEGYNIPYVDFRNDRRRWCRPDFTIVTPSQTAIVEVKPVTLRELQMHKLLAQYEYCLLNGMQFVVIGKEEIYTDGGVERVLSNIDEGVYHCCKLESCGIP